MLHARTPDEVRAIPPVYSRPPKRAGHGGFQRPRPAPLLSTHVTHLGQINIPGRVHQSNGVEVKAARARLSHIIPSPKVNLCMPQPVDILVERIVEGEPLSQQVHRVADVGAAVLTMGSQEPLASGVHRLSQTLWHQQY